MSTLARYRRPGGFKQLLMLVEGSGAKKQEQLMKVIAQEDRRWADCLRQRMLTIQTIFSWDAETVEKVMNQLPPQTWIQALFHLEGEERMSLFDRITQFVSHTRKRQLLDIMDVSHPTPGEVEAAHLMIIKKVRDLQASGEFKPESIDPCWAVSDLDKMAI